MGAWYRSHMNTADGVSPNNNTAAATSTSNATNSQQQQHSQVRFSIGLHLEFCPNYNYKLVNWNIKILDLEVVLFCVNSDISDIINSFAEYDDSVVQCNDHPWIGLVFGHEPLSPRQPRLPRLALIFRLTQVSLQICSEFHLFWQTNFS